MAGRPVTTILEEWRSLERLLHEPMGTAQRIDLERALAALADEHRAAICAQQSDADGLAGTPPMVLAEPST